MIVARYSLHGHQPAFRWRMCNSRPAVATDDWFCSLRSVRPCAQMLGRYPQINNLKRLDEQFGLPL
jgi:hypothetical protein